MSGARPRPTRPTRSAQRWPDLMIGAVTLALLAGFGALLLGERQRPVVAQTPPPASPVIPASPGTVPEPQPVQATPPASTPPASAPPATTTAPASSAAPSATTPNPTTPSATPEPASTAVAPETPTETPATTTPKVAQTSEIPPVPEAPPVEPIKPPVTTPPATTQAPATPSATTATTTPAPTTTATPAPATTATPVTAAPSAAVATSANRVPLRSDYRISLGSFSTRRTVESQTSGVRGLGYTVHAIDLGDQYVAQIGPFADEATARRALADIQRTYPGALLYRPRNAAQSSDTATANSNDNTNSSGSDNQTSTPVTQPTTQAAAPSGPVYLQVGAFDRAESAQNLVGILKDNGFAPTVNSPEGKLTTVMVGPYSGDAVLRAEARLDNANLDHFRVR